MRRSSLFLALSLVILPGMALAQDTLTLRPAPTSGVWIDGTSNKSTWTVEAKEVSGRLTMDAASVVETVLNVPAEKLESGRSRIMDRLMYRTLKTGEHKQISFTLSGPVPFTPSADGMTLTAAGKLAIAGVEKDVQFPVTGTRNGDGTWTFSGNYTFLLTDFGMDPPTAMFGALHTGDEVTVRFSVVAGS